MLKGALGMTEDDISHLTRPRLLQETSTTRVDAVETGRADAGFFMRATPVEQVQRGGGGRRVDAAEVDLLLPQDPHRPGLQPAAIAG